MVFRHDTDLPSCFGSGHPPPGFVGNAVPGLYFMDEERKWQACPWVEDEQDAGLVIVLCDASANTIDLVVFGYSGRATAAMARQVIPSPEKFWPPHCQWRDKKIGVYLCRFAVDGYTGDKEEYIVKGFEVIEVGDSVLADFLGRPAKAGR
jgi:hypothetical protein